MIIYGEPGTVVRLGEHKFVITISKNWICPRCNIFCRELVPVFTRKLLAMLKRKGENFSPVRIYCSNGCSERDDWDVEPFNWDSIADRNRIQDWPDKKGWSGKGKGRIGR